MPISVELSTHADAERIDTKILKIDPGAYSRLVHLAPSTAMIFVDGTPKPTCTLQIDMTDGLEAFKFPPGSGSLERVSLEDQKPLRLFNGEELCVARADETGIRRMWLVFEYGGGNDGSLEPWQPPSLTLNEPQITREELVLTY